MDKEAAVRTVNEQIDQLLTSLKNAIESRARLLGVSPRGQAHAYLDHFIQTFEDTDRVM